MDTFFHILLAIAALAVPLWCAYLIVRRLGRRHPRPLSDSRAHPEC